MILALALLLADVAWVGYAVDRALDASLQEADRQASAVVANDRRIAFTMSSSIGNTRKGKRVCRLTGADLGCLFVACSARQTWGVNHFTDSAKNPVIH